VIFGLGGNRWELEAGGHDPRKEKKAEVVVRGKSRPTTSRDVMPVQNGKDAGVYFLLHTHNATEDATFTLKWEFYASIPCQVVNPIISPGNVRFKGDCGANIPNRTSASIRFLSVYNTSGNQT
jgi:hypothetical protein